MKPTNNDRKMSTLTCGARVVHVSDGALGKIHSTPLVGATTAWVLFDGERESEVVEINDLNWGLNTFPFKKNDRVLANGRLGYVSHDQETDWVLVNWDQPEGGRDSEAIHWEKIEREPKAGKVENPIPGAIVELTKRAKALMVERDEKNAEYEAKIAELNTAINLLKGL